MMRAPLLLTALLIGAALGGHNEDPIQLCGARLLQNIRCLCNIRACGRVVPRSDPSMPTGPDNEVENNNSIGESDYSEGGNGIFIPNSPWEKLMALRGMSDAMAHPRFRRDVTKDCCHRPCTIGHIRKYYCPQRRSSPTTTPPPPTQLEPLLY